MDSQFAKNVVVLGYGVSGKAAAKWAHFLGEKVVVYDEKYIDEELRLEGVKFFEFDEDQLPEIGKVDLFIISPGISAKSSLLKWAKTCKAPILSELEYAAKYAQKPILAVTGTNGKTTTVELTAFLLQQLGIKASAVGNIGVAFCEALYVSQKENCLPDVWVVEVSSFQLEHMHQFSPVGAVLLNVTSDHINRYKNFTEYQHVKFKLFQQMRPEKCIVFEPLVDVFEETFYAKPLMLSSVNTSSEWSYVKPYIVHRNNGMEEKVFDMRGSQLRGEHNIQNTIAALQLIGCYDKNLLKKREILQAAITHFKLDGHRIEVVAEKNNKLFINDSKATNPDAVLAAIHLYGDIRNVRLILGGLDKQMDFSLLLPASGSVICAYIYGSCRERISESISTHILCEVFEKFDDAVNQALEDLESGEVLLLSPACASMDQFVDYRARGERFRVLVESYLVHDSK